MGAGSSAEQAGDKSPGTVVPAETAEPGTPPEILVVLQEDEGAADAKVLHKNGQISPINGTAEVHMEYRFQTEELNGLEAEVVVPNVGQRESSSVSQKEQASESLENMPQEESAAVEISPKDAQETTDEMPILEEKHEKVEESNEAQSNEVGFKKVFKFVGFRFTVKKDKTEKTEPVQLLTVKKDEVEANGTEKPEVKTPTADEKSEAVEHSKSDTLEADKLNEEVVNGVNQVEEETTAEKSSLEAPIEKVEEENAVHNESHDVIEGEKALKTSPVSPTNPLVTETTSPFKKFFTQGWAGLRKKTSFKKTKEDEQEKNKTETPAEASDSTLNVAEDHTVETSEATIKQEAVIALEENPETSIVDVKELTGEPSVPLADISTDLKLEETDESDVLIADAEIAPDKHVQHEEECSLLEVERATSVEAKTEHEVVIAVSEIISKEVAGEIEDAAEKVKAEATVLSSLEKSNEEQELQDVKLIDELPDVKEQSQILEVSQEEEIQQSPPDVSEQKPSDGVSNEVELLSSQEKTKLQGSPLRKLFTGSSLKKLSGKKHKAKKEDEPKPEEATEQLQSSSEVPEAPEIDKADSIPSSPEEPVDALSSEKPQTEAIQVSEGEGEGATSDGERKKDGITPWASFKKLVTPKKRAKKLSDSDKEDEPEKAGKSATMSSTDSSNSDNQEEAKVIEEEPKLEKSTEEPKRKVDSSVSWEALICVGSSKKRARKCSDSDEEETQKPLEEKPHEDDQKPDAEAEKNAEAETEVAITTSQESDQGQGGSSPEQAGSPSEGEGVSTWASFKRLVTPRRRSRTRMEEKVDEPTTTINAEHPTSEAEPGKDESWVSFKKLIPGRKKKKSDGKPEHALVEGQEIVEDEDGDVPAVVPLSEYEAAEQENIEAQQALQTEITKTIAPLSTPEKDLDQAEESCEGLIHAVTVTVVEGERAITSMEDRSPSWISATVTETIEQEDLCKDIQQTQQAIEMDVVIEPLVVVKTLDFVSSEVSGLTTAEMELTSEAVTALDEVMEASCAEETTEMVSAVSQLGESQATTEESTPVPEADTSQQTLEELQRQTQEVLKEVAEKVRHVEKITSTREVEVRGFPSQRSELDIKDDIPKDIVTVEASAFDEASLTKEELREREMDQEEHVDDLQKVEATVCRKVSEIVVESFLGAQELIEVDQSHMVEDEHVKHGKDSTEEHGEEIGGEIGEIVRHTLELKDQVLTSTIKMSSEPRVISEEIIVVQKPYQMSSAPQDKLTSETEANHIIDEHLSVELLTGEEQNVDILEEHIKVDQSHMVEDEDEGHGKDSTEEHGGKIEEVVRSALEMKDQLITSTIKICSETGLISEEIMVVQKQYQVSSAPEDKLSGEIGASDLINEHFPAVHSQNVELLTGEEESVDILAKQEKNILEVDLVQNSLDSTFNITTKEFSVIEPVVQAVQADVGEIIMPEIQHEAKEQAYAACSQESVQTEITLLVPEVIQQVTEIAGEESPCTELGAEQNEEPICLKEVIETKAKGIQTLLAQLVMLPQVDACESILEKVKMEENEFGAEKSEIEANQCMLFSQMEESLPVQEEVIVKHIPDVDASEAQVESVLITAAAVEEKLVTETVTLLEASTVTLEPVDATVTEDFASISSDAPAVESQIEKGMMDSVSQSAAAIIDAAFEAISSSALDNNLENVPLSHGEETEGDAKNAKDSQDIIQSQVEVIGVEIISQVSLDPQSSTFMQDFTHTVIEEVSGFDEELKSKYASEILSEMDTALIAGTIIEVQESKSDLHTEEKLSEGAVIEKHKLICQINTTENIVSEANLQVEIIGQPDGKIKISDDTQEVCVDQVAAALEESTTHSSNLSASESLEIFPSVPKPSDVQVDLECGHPVDIEHQMVEIVQSIQNVATREVDTAEDKVAIEAAVGEQHLDKTVKVSNGTFEVKETVEQLEPELNTLQTEYDQAEVNYTVSIETHSSTIVEKIIQTAVEEVEKVEEEVTASTVPEVEHEKDTEQSIKVPPENEVVREPVEEQKLMSVAIEEGSDFSHVVITQSYCSTVVETIVMTRVEDERLVCNSETEVQSPVETDQSPEDAIMSEFQDVLEQTIKEPSIHQTEKGHSESNGTVSIESQSTTIIQTVEVGDTAREEAHKAAEEPGEFESNRILDGTSGTGDHALTVSATKDSVTCSEGQEEADIQSSVQITAQVKEPLGLTQDSLLSDVCNGEASIVSFQVAVEPTETVQRAHEVFEQVSQQTAAKDYNDIPDQVSDATMSDIHCRIGTIEIHEGACAFEADKTLETDHIAASVESEVQNEIEHSQKSTEEAVCDSQDWEQAAEPSSAETTVEVKVGPSVVADLTESQVSIRQMQDIVLSDTFKGDMGTVAFQVTVETTRVVQQEHEFIEHLAVQVCQENPAEANNDPPVMEPKLLKEEIALQGVEDGQQSDPHPESQTKHVDRERPASDTEITELPAALSQECLEVAEQLKVTKTVKTEVHEQVIFVDSTLPSQVEEEEQIQASEDAKSAEHALQEHPHLKSESAES